MKRLATLLSVLLLAMGWTMINADEAHAQDPVLISFWHFNDVTSISGSMSRINPLGDASNMTRYTTDLGVLPAQLSTWGDSEIDGTLSGTNGGTDNNNFGSFGGTSSGDQGEGSGGSLSISGPNNNDRFFTISFSEAVEDLSLTYYTRGSGSGFNTHAFAYSIDGGETVIPFTTVPAQQNSTWSERVVDFDDVFNASSNNIIYVTVSGATASNGNSRFDNIRIEGIVLDEPEPPTPSVAFATATETVQEGDNFDLGVTLSNYDDSQVSIAVEVDEEDWFTTEFPLEYTFEEDSTRTFNIQVEDDEVYTEPRTAVFTLSVTDGDATLGLSTFTLTIEDSSDPPAPESVLAYWNFNNPGSNPVWPQPIVATLGNAAITYSFDESTVDSFSGSTLNSLDSDPAGDSFAPTGGTNQINNGEHLDITLSTIGYENIQLSFAGRGTSTGFGSESDPNTVQYSIDGGDTFVTLDTYTSRETSFQTYDFDFGDVLDNTNEVIIRLVLDGSTSSSGNNRIDNIQVEGNEIQGVLIDGEAGWRMLSSITNGATVQDLANVNVVHGIPGEYEGIFFSNLFTGYDGDATNTEDTNAGWVMPSGLDQVLEAGKGFIWYFYHEEYEDGYTPDELGGEGVSIHHHLPTTITYTGSPVVENHSVTFDHDDRAADDDGFYLIGNPYAEEYAVSGISADVGVLGTTFSQYNPEIDDYDEFLANENDVAPVGAGFFAEFTTVPETDVTFTFGPPVAERTDSEVLFARFQLSGELTVPYEGTDFTFDILDRNARAVFTDLATDGRDRYDATKLNPLSEYWAGIAMIGVQGAETIRRAAESRPMPLEAITLPMALTTHTAADLEAGGTFTIELVTDALGSGWQVSLRDLETGQTVNMLTDSYTFTLPVQPAIAADERFELTFTPPTVSGDDDGESLAFGLEALWPNPTHGTTRVAFTLPQAQDVTLDVFDVLGRRVMQIANDEYGSGRHVLPMSTSALASGVYVVRLTAGSQTAVQRVTVAR